MRLGKKKEKDKEAEIRSVDGIIRLICLSKGQAPLKGKDFFSFFFLNLFICQCLKSFYLYSFEISVKVRMQNNVYTWKNPKDIKNESRPFNVRAIS